MLSAPALKALVAAARGKATFKLIVQFPTCGGTERLRVCPCNLPLPPRSWSRGGTGRHAGRYGASAGHTKNMNDREIVLDPSAHPEYDEALCFLRGRVTSTDDFKKSTNNLSLSSRAPVQPKENFHLSKQTKKTTQCRDDADSTKC